MLQTLGILFILVVGMIFVLATTSSKSKKPYDLHSFLKWTAEVHAGEETSTTVIDYKAETESKSVKITFDFRKDRGILHDKALDKKYKIVKVDGEYITLNK
jgi:hypothetical protein